MPIAKSFDVDCTTSAGTFSMRFVRSSSPHGYERVSELFRDKFYDGTYLYRIVPNFLVQFGLPSTDAMKAKYHFQNTILDDPLPTVNTGKSPAFKKGTISFAGSGPNSRGEPAYLIDLAPRHQKCTFLSLSLCDLHTPSTVSDLFISYVDSSHLGKSAWESPVGYVTSGMDVVESFKSYGDISAFNRGGPNPNKIRNRGKEYISSEFPDMDYFKSCKIVEGTREEAGSLKGKSEPTTTSTTTTPRLALDDPFVLVNLSIVVVSGLVVCLLFLRLCSWGVKKKGRARRSLDQEFNSLGMGSYTKDH